MKKILEPFLKHPHENKMTYCQHMCTSFSFGFHFSIASMYAYLHGCFPCCCKTSSSDYAEYITNAIENMKYIDHKV